VPTNPPPELAGLVPSGGVRREDVSWRRAGRVAGAGFFLAGDAAGVLDPASSHGVLRAVMGGMMAGHLAARVVAGADEVVAAAEYQNWLAEWFDRDAARLRQWYRSVDLDVAEPA
jgi:flavin-dependent dehydrogenase